MHETLDAIRYLERTVTAAGGLALRYGGLYGSPEDRQIELVRKRRFAIVGDGGGIWSFVHLDDAASATVLALERGAPGVYNVVDDEPAPVSEWHRPRWPMRSGRSRRAACRAGSRGSSRASRVSC
jgi:NAD dependent epimerase/dehydratase family enzyme